MTIEKHLVVVEVYNSSRRRSVIYFRALKKKLAFRLCNTQGYSSPETLKHTRAFSVHGVYIMGRQCQWLPLVVMQKDYTLNSMYCIFKIQVRLDTRDPRKIIEAGIGYGGKAVEVLLGSVSAIELSGRRSFQKAV